MPIAPILTMYSPGGDILPAPVIIPESDDELTGSYVEEFAHQVYTIKKDYYYTLLNGVDFVRRHEPMTIIKQIDKTSILLIDYLQDNVLDGCAGPHTGNESRSEYLDNSIDRTVGTVNGHVNDIVLYTEVQIVE